MPTYTTGSKVTAKLASPGGIQLSGTYDTNQVPLTTVIDTFGTSNVEQVTNVISQFEEGNLAATSRRTVLQTTLRTIESRTIPTITRMTEFFYQSPSFGRYTASLSPTQTAAVTSSARIEVEPFRSSSAVVEVRELYTVSASLDTGSNDKLKKTVSMQEYLQHRKVSENFKTEPVTLSDAPGEIVLLSGEWDTAAEALAVTDSDYGDHSKYLSGSILYTKSDFTDPYVSTAAYLKVKDNLRSLGVFPSGRIFDNSYVGSKNKFIGPLTVNSQGVDTFDEAKNTSFDDKDNIKLYYYQGYFYKDRFLTEDFSGNDKWYWIPSLGDFAEIDDNGTVKSAQIAP